MKKLELREELEKRGLEEKEIEERVTKLEKRLNEKLSKGQYSLDKYENVQYFIVYKIRMPLPSRRNLSNIVLMKPFRSNHISQEAHLISKLRIKSDLRSSIRGN